jgi:HK97 family phage portal protein
MIHTLASLALDAGHDILTPDSKRWIEVSDETKVWNGLHYAGTTGTGISVSEANALSYMPVLACTRVISETLASLPLKVFRDAADGPEVAKNHYLYPLLHDAPNPEMTAFNLWESVGVSLCLYNHFYGEIEWNNAGRVRAIWPLLPDRVSMRRVNGRLVYDYLSDDGPVSLDSADVLHIPGCLNLTGVTAESLIRWAREAIGLGLAPEKYQANFYKNNARPGMYLTFPAALSKDTRAQIAQSWNDIHAGISGAGRTGVVEGGGKIEIPSVNQKDSEFSETRKRQFLYICAMYRVPPHMVAELSEATYSNIEHQDISFAKHTMTPYCKRAEQVLNMKLLGIGSGYYAEFNLDGLMRGDLLSRTQAHAQAIQTAQLTPNEARKKENRPALENGDKLYIQGATVPLDMAGKFQAKPQPTEEKESK